MGRIKSFNSDNQDTANTFDGNGNPTTYDSASLTFDPENRMTAFGSALTAAYRADGLRAWKDGSSQTYFLYDGTLPVVELNSSGAVIAANTFGDNGLLSRRVSSTSTFYQFDPQGGTAQRLNSSCGVTLSTGFDAWGNQVGTAGSDPFQYGAQSGYYTDTETGLALLTHRYYDPTAGRFLNRDPVSYDGGINLYGYVGNEPDDWIDSDGLSRRKGKNPPDNWPPFPANLGGKSPKWNPEGYWNGKGGGYVYDPTGHGTPHWDRDEKPGNKKGKGKRWDTDGNPIPCQAEIDRLRGADGPVREDFTPYFIFIPAPEFELGPIGEGFGGILQGLKKLFGPVGNPVLVR